MPIIEASGHGGGSSFLTQHVTTITDAQWKALPVGGATIEVVPTPGVGKAIYCPAVHGVGFAAIEFDWHADYTNVDASCQVFFAWGANAGQTTYTVPPGFLAWGEPATWPIILTDAASGGVLSGLNSTSELVNRPVLMGVYNGALGAFTGGGAANGFTVSVAYYVYDV